jgi:hypothetical protein
VRGGNLIQPGGRKCMETLSFFYIEKYMSEVNNLKKTCDTRIFLILLTSKTEHNKENKGKIVILFTYKM